MSVPQFATMQPRHRFVFLATLCLVLSHYLHAQSTPRFDVTAGPGVNLQFSKIVNESFDAGPHAHASLAWRVQEKSNLSLFVGYDYLRSSFSRLTSIEDVEAQFISFGIRVETKPRTEFFNPYLMIGAGWGSAKAVVPDPNAYASIRNTAVMFGVGFALRVQPGVSVVPLIRLVVSEGSEVSMPISCCARFEL